MLAEVHGSFLEFLGESQASPFSNLLQVPQKQLMVLLSLVPIQSLDLQVELCGGSHVWDGPRHRECLVVVVEHMQGCCQDPERGLLILIFNFGIIEDVFKGTGEVFLLEAAEDVVHGFLEAELGREVPGLALHRILEHALFILIARRHPTMVLLPLVQSLDEDDVERDVAVEVVRKDLHLQVPCVLQQLRERFRNPQIILKLVCRFGFYYADFVGEAAEGAYEAVLPQDDKSHLEVLAHFTQLHPSFIVDVGGDDEVELGEILCLLKNELFGVLLHELALHVRIQLQQVRTSHLGHGLAEVFGGHKEVVAEVPFGDHLVVHNRDLHDPWQHQILQSLSPTRACS
mmetsp:Transcript_17183/g.16406  ORF Transcript_17183/g.16406 Transcript_17183/m.16406 type:complete len:344 (-) Transcript_17183:86-1117(-)